MLLVSCPSLTTTDQLRRKLRNDGNSLTIVIRVNTFNLVQWNVYLSIKFCGNTNFFAESSPISYHVKRPTQNMLLHSYVTERILNDIVVTLGSCYQQGCTTS